jgi:hypothetical protein
VIRATIVMALLATPAMADLSPDVAAALDICMADGPTLQARVTQLGDAGWRFPNDTDIAEAALAIAPLQLFRLASIKTGQDPLERLDALTRAAGVMAREIDRDLPGAVFLVTDSGAVLHLTSRNPATVDCALAGQVELADMAAHTGLDAETTTSPLYITTRLTTPGTDDRRAYHDRFAPGLFGATDPLPIISTLSARITD